MDSKVVIIPTYNEKEPALSVIITCRGEAPFHFDTLIRKN